MSQDTVSRAQVLGIQMIEARICRLFVYRWVAPYLFIPAGCTDEQALDALKAFIQHTGLVEAV